MQLPRRKSNPSSQSSQIPAELARGIVGYAVHGIDGNAGRVDAATAATGRQQLVVGTGTWPLRRRRLIPTAVLDGVDDRHRIVHVAMRRDQIDRSPRFDPRLHGFPTVTDTGDEEFFDRFGRFLGGF
jgi:hypothetical protein